MAYYYDQTPGASSSKEILDPQVSFTADFGGAVAAGWGPSSGCGSTSWRLHIDEIPGQWVSTQFSSFYVLSAEPTMWGSCQDYLDYTMLSATDAFEEARLSEQYAEFFDEDALPAAFSGSAEEQRGICNPMVDVALGEAQPGWTIPRSFGEHGRGETSQVCTPHPASFIRRSTHR